MPEYIEREALIDALQAYQYDAGKDGFGIMVVIGVQPAADVEPVKYGHWEWIKDDIYRCTNCGEESHVKQVMGKPDWVGCPNCRAKMDGGDAG